MKYLVSTPFFLLDKRGNAKPVTQGTILTKKQYGALTTQKQNKCEPIAPTYGEAWAYEEDALAGHYYHDMIDPELGAGEIDLANTLAGILSRSEASIHMKIAQIKRLDSRYRAHRDGGSVEGLQGSNQIKTIMNEIDPERYGV